MLLQEMMLYEYLHADTDPGACRQAAFTPFVLPEVYGLITMPCARIIIEYSQIDPRSRKMLFDILYSEPEHFLSVSFSSARGIHDYKAESNRAVIVSFVIVKYRTTDNPSSPDK